MSEQICICRVNEGVLCAVGWTERIRRRSTPWLTPSQPSWSSPSVAPPPRCKVAQQISLKQYRVPKPSALISLQHAFTHQSFVTHHTCQRYSLLTFLPRLCISLPDSHLIHAVISELVFFYSPCYYPLHTSLSALSPIVRDNPANLRTPFISPLYSRLFSPSGHSPRGVHQSILPI